MKIRFLMTLPWWLTRAFLRRERRPSASRFALVCLGAMTLTSPAQPVTMADGMQAHPTRLLARYKESVVTAARATALTHGRSRLHREFDLVPRLVVLEDTGSAGTTAAASAKAETPLARLLSRMEALRQSGLFEFVEPDYLVQASLTPNDLAFVDGTLWGLRNNGQEGGKPGADIGAPAAWNLTTGDTNVIVAVIDTGIRYTHRDLTNQMWRNPGEIPGNGLDDDGNGFVDDVHGINAINGSGDPFDYGDHGTHCSGTIGAQANGGGPMVGVTWRVRLMGCKFLGSYGGATSDAITCINYAVNMGARIMNNSWGGGGYSQALFNAIIAARSRGVLFVAAAGNNGTDNDQFPFYPANYPVDNIVSVAAVDRNDQLAYFSCYGADSVELGAPGMSIYSCSSASDTSYMTMDGTSMAAPHVSGVAALIWSLFPDASLDEVRQRLLMGAKPIAALNGKTATGGRLNAINSLSLAGGGVLQMSVDPPDGSALLTASSQPVFVRVSNPFGVINATVTAAVAGVTNLVFRNDGQPPDVISSNDVYSAVFQVPASTNPLTMTVVATAPDRIGVTNVIHYAVVPPPSNDNFADAVKAPAGGAAYVSNNRFATLEAGEPTHNGYADGAASLWWTLTPARNTNVFVDATGSKFEAVLAVYTGNQLTNLVTVTATNSNRIQHRPAYVNFNATGGTAYRIVLASQTSDSVGTVRLRIAPGGQKDTTPPQIFVTSPMSGLTVFEPLLEVTGTAVDPAPNVSGVSEVLVALNDGIAGSALGTANWNTRVLLEPGFNRIEVRCLDEAGNSSTPVILQVNYVVLGPPNDLFANADLLSGLSGSVNVQTANAKKEFGEPNHVGNSGGKSVWWSFVPPADGVLSLSTSNSTFDTLLAVYTGETVGALTAIAGNDDADAGGAGGFSSVVQAVRSNQTCWIAVDGYDGVAGQAFLHYSFMGKPVFYLTVSNSSGGTVLPGSGNYASNATVVLTAVPDLHYQLAGWSGSVVSSDNPLTLVITSNRTVTGIFAPVEFTDGFESGALLHLPWLTGGNMPWMVTDEVAAAGQWAARSGFMTNDPLSYQVSSLSLNANFATGDGSFDYRVSSEPTYDYLKFSVDGEERQRWSGEQGWANYVFPLTAGIHTLQWDYVKDTSLSAGLDAAFLDNLILPFVSAVSIPAALQLSVTNNGTAFILLVGQTNQPYVLQVSTNLTDWQNLATNVATGGCIQFVDPGAVSHSRRFYRSSVLTP